MNIHLYTILWNEEDMLPFFFRHYDSVVDRYVAYDDGSTDNTLEMLAAHARVEIRPLVRAHPTSYVLSAQALHDSMWKESRGSADWVIITAVDEHLYHPIGLRSYLRLAGYRGITAVPAVAFQMVTDTFPSTDEYLARTRRFGAPLDLYNKLSVFNPEALTETHYAVGRHLADPEGRVHYPKRDQLLLFHYKYLGIDYLHHRYALLGSKLGVTDREHGFGYHYHVDRAKLETELAEVRRNAFEVTGGAGKRFKRQKWWRPAGTAHGS
jgi:glycosyltransferase involved in cell wall biosynthesis